MALKARGLFVRRQVINSGLTRRTCQDRVLEGMDTERKMTDCAVAQGGTFVGKRIHLIGIGGCGMRAMAQMLIDRGADVSGSDMRPGAALDRLADSGASVYIGQRIENIAFDREIVVHSAAIRDHNPELLAARQCGLDVLKYSQMLGRLMAEGTGIAVAGTHGKSTTTAMVAYALSLAGADPSYIVGATVEQLGGPSGAGGGRHFVAEACEYDRSFLNLRPQYAAILNVEEDHLDCYENLAEIVEAFRSFSSLVAPGGVLVVNGQDAEAVEAAGGASCEVETFGFTKSCTWRGVNTSLAADGCYKMDVLYDGQEFGHVGLSIPGIHNAYNALAGAALLHHAGLDPEMIVSALTDFSGTDRRLTLKGRVAGVTVVDDYAHHPTEVDATLQAIREYYRPKRLLCVFQPHQHSRTRFLLKDFARSFGQADEIIVPDIFFVRDGEGEKACISSKDLVSQITLNKGRAVYKETFKEIETYLQQMLRAGDLVVTMGAGNVWEVADGIVRWLRKNRQGG